jgi:hypothetical protein
MTKPIEISSKNYQRLLEQLKKDYPPSVILVRNKMKDKLGFVPREYKDWGVEMQFGGWRKNCIMLDFYSEKKRTWFIMKYSEFLTKEAYNDDF